MLTVINPPTKDRTFNDVQKAGQLFRYRGWACMTLSSRHDEDDKVWFVYLEGPNVGIYVSRRADTPGVTLLVGELTVREV